MTRVLQIRRGTAAQNNDFTGLPGEITMDTDAKTLRIHDGETLGGFALQRADVAAPGAFDITTVPDEFWSEIVGKYAPAPFSIVESKLCPMNSNTAYLNCVFGGDKMPHFVRVALVCKNDEAGYVAGDEVWAFGIGEWSNMQPNCFIDKNGLNVRLMVNAGRYWTHRRDTGAPVELTDENWNILFRVYY